MSKVKIINMLTKEEAEKKYAEFISDVKANNRRAVLLIIAVILSAFLISWTMWGYLNGGLQTAVMIVICVFTAIIVHFCLESFEPQTKPFWPAVYQYHQLTENHQVIKAEAESDSVGIIELVKVVLTLENDKNEVSRGWIYGLKKVTKTNVDQITVDLAEEKVYYPYVE